MDDLISRQAAIDAPFKKFDMNTGVTWIPLEHIEQLPSAQPEQRWIPCSEKPDTDRNVFVARGTSENMSVCVGHYEHDLKQWYEDRNWFAKCLYDGLYWCEMPPLPAPYQGEGDSNDRQM